jgi:transcriptional regulator with XRE-family HTH domain
MTAPVAVKDVGRRALISEFLRSRRSRLTSQSVGLPEGRRRRVAGLRREEVAVLADVGITWYTWLEQGRPIRMAPATLDRICDALRLDRDERAYLHRLVFFTADEASWKVTVLGSARVECRIRAYLRVHGLFSRTELAAAFLSRSQRAADDD